MQSLNPTAAYRRELKTTVRPYIGGLVATAVIVGTLVGTILYVAFSSGGSSDLKQGMVNVSLIAIFPTIIGVRLAHQNFISDHRATVLAMKNLGVSNGFFQRHFLLQALALAGVASVSAVVLGRVILRPFLNLLFLGMGKELPDVWGAPLPVLGTALIVLGLIYLAGVGTIRLDRVVGQASIAGASNAAVKKAGKIAGIVVAALNITCGVWLIAAGGSSMAVAVMVLTTPVLAAVMAGPLSRFASRAISSVLSRTVGWTAPAVGIRSIAATGTLSRAGLAAALVAIPLAGFSWAISSLDAGAYYTTQNVSEAPVIVTGDARLLAPGDAEKVCAQIGDSCHGVVYWQPSDITYSGSESASHEVANDYTIAGSNFQAIDEFLSGAEAPAKEDPFHLDYMQLSAAVSENPPVDPDWALVVTDSSAQAPEGYSVMPAKKWAEGSGKDTQLFYGPSGDGTAGFIPLAAYTLLAICVILVVATIGKRSSLQRFFSPLHLLGKTRSGIQATAFWAVLFPYLTATLAAVAAGLWLTTVAHIVTTGRVGAWTPFMPLGLWILFGVVFLATSATVFFPHSKKLAINGAV